MVIDLDPVQPVVHRELPQQRLGQHVLTSAPPRMGDHGHATGLMHQVDAAMDLDRVPRHVGRAAVGQEPVERLGPVTHMTGLDHRVGDVRPAHRRALAHLGQHLALGHRHTQFRESLQHRGQPAHPAAADLLQLRGQPGRLRVDAVPQEVDAVPLSAAGQLQAPHHGHTTPLPLRDRLVQAVHPDRPAWP
jgi:hypothetical protein